MFSYALLILGLFIQDPATDKKSDEAKPVEAAAVTKLTDKDVVEVLKQWKKDSREKKPKLAKHLSAVQALGKGSHDKLVKPLASVVKKARPLTVRREAARALGNQPPKIARGAILKLIGDKAVQQTPIVTADLIGSLDKAGYTSNDWKSLEKLFDESYAEKHRPKQKAILVLAGNQRELKALSLLLDNLDEPAPADPNSPSNPPAEYWEKRWKAWRSWRDDAKAALFTITGQRFSTAQEARTWISKNRKQLKNRKR